MAYGNNRGPSNELDFKRPPEWTDEDRMYFLLAPFQETNTLNHLDPKAMFWRSLINSSSKDLGECVFTIGQLCERLQWREMQPKCLNDVINTMERTGEIVKTSKAYQGWVGWGVSMVTSPMSWAWKKYVYSGSNDSEEFMIVSHVKELADSVFTAHMKGVVHSSTDCLYTRMKFEEKCNSILNNPSAQCLKAVQFELIKQGLAVVGVSPESQNVIKLAKARNFPVSSVSESDHGIVSMKITLGKLQSLIDKKLQNQARLKQKCLELMKHKQKSRALHFLRLSKSFESDVIRLEKHSENLQTILNQIEMADTNAEVLKAFERGSSALKRVREENDLTIERVENVMDEVQQLIEEGEDINECFNRDIHDDVTDDELLIELELINSDQTSSRPDTSAATVSGMEDIIRGLESMTMTVDRLDDSRPTVQQEYDSNDTNTQVSKVKKKSSPSVLLN